jgi:tRNA threonylcarbamoyladenosine biosynthesis protein TsaB
MPHLAQLLANHRRILVLDAVSLQVQVGLLHAGLPGVWAESHDEAGRGLFRATDRVLTQGSVGPDQIDAFLFCEGPGSMLGTRTVAMAVRTWLALKRRPVFRYQSLALAATVEWRSNPRPLAVIADARRESWHVQRIDLDGNLAPLERCASSDLPAGELLTPAGFRVWSKSPPQVRECSYAVAHLLESVGGTELFHPVESPEPFQPGVPDYKKWSAQPHSAETAKPK